MTEQKELQKTTEEKIKEFVEGVRPYIIKLWNLRRKLLIFNGVVLVLTILYLLFFVKPYYQTSVTILPDFGNKTSDMFSQYSGIASLAGVNIGETPPTQIYQNLVLSESVLTDVIMSKYQTQKFNHPVNMIEYFEIQPDKSLSEIQQKRKMFLLVYEAFAKGRIITSYDRFTKILIIIAEMPESKLAADIVNKVVESLDYFVRTKRKSFASEQRKYLELRLDQVKDSLTKAEEALKNFREQNRQIVQSPLLQLDQARLIRVVEIQQSIFGELSKQSELVKLAEIKDTPVVNVREVVQEPVIKAGPKRAIILIVIVLLSITISILWLFNKEKLRIVLKLIKHVKK
jgi:hypothetical protein